MKRRPTVFLDRDGTLTEPRHYPSRPEDLVLSPGVGPHLRALQDLGMALVVVTNQSALARGLFDEDALVSMHLHLCQLLTAEGVKLDAILYCPHHVDGVVPHLSIACDCRKPEPGMLLQGARDLELDLSASWMVGDLPSDVEAGRRAGCRTARVVRGDDSAAAAPADIVAASTAGALGAIRDAVAGISSGRLAGSRKIHLHED
jgi:D-glycero-D-manno-heptose 1,7-bisphosphate phosphatase